MRGVHQHLWAQFFPFPAPFVAPGAPWTSPWHAASESRNLRFPSDHSDYNKCGISVGIFIEMVKFKTIVHLKWVFILNMKYTIITIIIVIPDHFSMKVWLQWRETDQSDHYEIASDFMKLSKWYDYDNMIWLFWLWLLWLLWPWWWLLWMSSFPTNLNDMKLFYGVHNWYIPTYDMLPSGKLTVCYSKWP